MKYHIVKKIYDNLICKYNVSDIDLFLCGGANKSIHIRDKIKIFLKKEDNIVVLYPEELFSDYINSKKYDLLTLEKYLADNSDVIVIVAESPGSYAELGAFVNNVHTFKKVVVLLNTRYKYNNSFITKGPVEYVKKNNKDNVIYFNSNLDDIEKNLINLLKQRFPNKHKYFKHRRTKDIISITGIMNTIIFILYFYKEIDKYEMQNNIRCLFDNLINEKYQDYKDIYNSSYFNAIYNAAKNRLFDEKLIEINNISNKQYYKITEKGNNYVSNCFKCIEIKNREYNIDGIRLSVIREQYY